MSTSNSLRVYTCTPKPFRGDHAFFARDSGLTCRGLQSLGVESRAIILSPAREWDGPDLIRATMDNLKSPDWWRALHLDGVVLYAWGAGRYRQIAWAIKQSGAKVYVHMDTGGLISPLIEWRNWMVGNLPAEYRRIAGWPRFLATVFVRHTAGFFWVDPRRVQHLRQADVIGAVSPVAEQRLRKYCRIWGGKQLAGKVHLCPAPVAPYFEFKTGVKSRQIIAVGRWGPMDKVKRPELLMNTLRIVLAADPDVKAVVVGHHPEQLMALMNEWAVSLRERVTITGVLRNDQLRDHYCRAQVSICSSRSESFHIASAEAVCCGCSVVSPDLPVLPSLRFFASKNSGTLATGESPEAMGRAALHELQLWEAGARDPVAISRAWCAELHADNVARRILDLLGLKLGNS